MAITHMWVSMGSPKALDAILTDPLGAALDLAGAVNVRAPGEKKAKEKAAKREKYAAMFGPLGCGFLHAPMGGMEKKNYAMCCHFRAINMDSVFK